MFPYIKNSFLIYVEYPSTIVEFIHTCYHTFCSLLLFFSFNSCLTYYQKSLILDDKMNAKLPDISKEVEKLIFDKLETFNKGKTTDKSCYYILVPTDKTLYYTLWFFNLNAVYHPSVYISNLELNAISSINKAIHMVANSFLPLYITDKTDSFFSHGDDIISFGKYRGHHLQDIYTIDPRYVCWLADKYEAQTKSEHRFKEIAVTYSQIYIDLYTRKKYKTPTSSFVGTPGNKLTNLNLTITKVRIEDDPYKTRIENGSTYFYVDQLITAIDTEKNLFLFTYKAKERSFESHVLSCYTHAYRVEEKIHLSSAKILKHIEIRGIKYTKLGYIKF